MAFNGFLKENTDKYAWKSKHKCPFLGVVFYFFIFASIYISTDILNRHQKAKSFITIKGTKKFYNNFGMLLIIFLIKTETGHLSVESVKLSHGEETL